MIRRCGRLLMISVSAIPIFAKRKCPIVSFLIEDMIITHADPENLDFAFDGTGALNLNAQDLDFNVNVGMRFDLLFLTNPPGRLIGGFAISAPTRFSTLHPRLRQKHCLSGLTVFSSCRKTFVSFNIDPRPTVRK